MEIAGQLCDVAYFRDIQQSDQCELSFFLNTELPVVGVVKEEIKAVRNINDNISSLIQHVKNKIQKLISDRLGEIGKENQEEIEVYVSLKRGNKYIKAAMVLKNFQLSLVANEHVILVVFNQKFVISLNAPLVKQMKLPPVLYANFSIQPVKFHAIFTDNKQSIFTWYRSKDQVIWKEIGIGFFHFLMEESVGHFIKLTCIPCNGTNMQGPSAEAVSEAKVEMMGNLPLCPFEIRHQYTKKTLTGMQFRVVSYNILAERYAGLDENYAYCNPRFLAIDYRKQLILKELLGFKADIICLQEVDNRHYTAYFKSQFSNKGYASVYHRKGNRIPEGLACFFNKSRYKQVESKQIVLSFHIQNSKMFLYLWNIVKRNEELKNSFLKQSTSVQVTVLKTKDTNRVIIVANTHLYYHSEADHIRLLQINMATTYLNSLKKRYEKDNRNVSVIFCGDFNSFPTKSLFPYMLQGSISPTHEDCLKIHEDGTALLYHHFNFESSCGTPKYTNYTPDFKGCLDYIFIENNKLLVSQVVPLTPEEELSKHEGLPNEFFPSDHLPLVVDLKFKGTPLN